jgi:ribonuclease I
MILMMTCCLLLSELTDYLFCINNNDTRYYYLSLKRVNKNTSWSIHGLWPQYSQTSYPQFCKNIPFDIEKIKPILLDLNKFWYSGIEPNNVFWKHEWEKHGTCMFNDSDEFDYFKTVLSLYVEVIQSNIINKFKLENDGLQVKIPIDLNFKPILPN